MENAPASNWKNLTHYVEFYVLLSILANFVVFNLFPYGSIIALFIAAFVIGSFVGYYFSSSVNLMSFLKSIGILGFSYLIIFFIAFTFNKWPLLGYYNPFLTGPVGTGFFIFFFQFLLSIGVLLIFVLVTSISRRIRKY